MNARDVIEANEALQGACRKHASAHSPLVVADNIVRDLYAAGFTIMSKEDVEAVRQALVEYEAMADHVGGCGDSNCLVFRPTGQRTNGGCRCHYDKRKSQRMMSAGQRLYTTILSLKSGGCEGKEARE